MLREHKNPTIYGMPRAIGGRRLAEKVLVAQFASWVNALGPLSQASVALQARLLKEVEAVARGIDGSVEVGLPSRYGRRVLHEVPDRWSLAAIILRPGQQTEQHDHGGWDCAMTVQGVERDRRFALDASGSLVLNFERDYPAGAGYVFDAVDVHQPIGADPRRVTVALYFLVHDGGHKKTNPETIDFSYRHVINAA